MRALDLFCGACGGWSIGLHANGIETVAACEIDSWRRETFSRNFPNARMYDDVRSLTADRLRNDLGFLPDVIVGSPPCQDASTANHKGKGVDGERTGLFFEAVRLVREVRPDWCILENVPGLRARGYDRVHDALEEAGYSVRPLVVGAVHAGAPHRRNRVWIVAVATSEQVGRTGQSRGQTVGDDAAYAAQGRRRELVAEGQGRQAHIDAVDCGRVGDNANTTLMLRPPIARDQSDGLDEPSLSDAQGVGGGAGLRKGGPVGHGHGAPGSGLLAAWQDWNGGPPDARDLDDGLSSRLAYVSPEQSGAGCQAVKAKFSTLPKGMARKMLSAYGDAVVPQVTTAVIRATLHALTQRNQAA